MASQTPLPKQIRNKIEFYIAQFDKELSKFPLVIEIEKRTKCPKTYFFGDVSVVLFKLIFFNVWSDLLTDLILLLCPTYASFKANESTAKEDDMQWLTYWCVFGFLNLIKFFADKILFWVPFYYTFKAAFLLYLLLPQFWGAQVLYAKFLHHYLVNDAGIAKVKASAASAVPGAIAPWNNHLDAKYSKDCQITLQDELSSLVQCVCRIDFKNGIDMVIRNFNSAIAIFENVCQRLERHISNLSIKAEGLAAKIDAKIQENEKLLVDLKQHKARLESFKAEHDKQKDILKDRESDLSDLNEDLERAKEEVAKREETEKNLRIAAIALIWFPGVNLALAATGLGFHLDIKSRLEAIEAKEKVMLACRLRIRQLINDIRDSKQQIRRLELYVRIEEDELKQLQLEEKNTRAALKVSYELLRNARRENEGFRYVLNAVNSKAYRAIDDPVIEISFRLQKLILTVEKFGFVGVRRLEGQLESWKKHMLTSASDADFW